jgi:hypothetical protein
LIGNGIVQLFFGKIGASNKLNYKRDQIFTQ